MPKSDRSTVLAVGRVGRQPTLPDSELADSDRIPCHHVVMADHFLAPSAWASYPEDDTLEQETSLGTEFMGSGAAGAQPMPLSLAAQGVRNLDLGSSAKQRLTFAWVQGREPVVLPLVGGGHATVVVAWPTTPDGQLLARGEPVAMVAHLSEPQLHQIRWIGESWPLQYHDVWVQRGEFNPCAFSLRRAPRFKELRHHIEVLVRVLMTFESGIDRHLMSGLAG